MYNMSVFYLFPKFCLNPVGRKINAIIVKKRLILLTSFVIFFFDFLLTLYHLLSSLSCVTTDYSTRYHERFILFLCVSN